MSALYRYSTDQMNRKVRYNFPPQRIVSLVPSQTELLFDLDLQERIVGRTKFCIHPHDKLILTPKIGGTKKLDMKKIHLLQPDLIIGNKEENDRQQIELLKQDFPVWMSDICTLDDALDMIAGVGKITGTEDTSVNLCDKISIAFKGIKKVSNRMSVLYLIWKKPWMTVGKNTFIDDMLSKCGFENILMAERYPILSNEDISALTPEVILLSSEPYPFSEKHIPALQKLAPSAKIILVNGEFFSWYGSRLLYAPEYFNRLIKELT